MFNKVVFWLSNFFDLLWAVVILWAGYQLVNIGIAGWLVIILLALYPVQVISQRFKIKRLSGE